MPEDNSHAGRGSVMLDIGGDIGALVVVMPAAMEGIEVEIRPLGAADETPRDITGVGDAHAGHDHHAHTHNDHSHDDHPHDDHAHDDHSHDDHSHDDHSHDDHSHDDHAHGHSHDPARAWPHVAVVARTAPVGIVHSLVYAQLREGSYELYVRPNEPVALTAQVTGGHVTQVEWPR